MAKIQRVIFVRGGVPDGDSGDGKTSPAAPWEYFHFSPIKDVLPKGVELTYFDFPSFKVFTWHTWDAKRGHKAPSVPDGEADIGPLINLRMSDGSVDTRSSRPSALSVYDFVRSQSPGSVLSFQVFSHGDYDGPILWRESFENVSKGDLRLPRDPHDSEFRRRDFFGSNPLAGAQGTAFARAFAPHAFVKIWGCAEDQAFRNELRVALKPSGGAVEQLRRLTLLTNYLDKVEISYAALLSRRLGVPVWGAPIGWGTNPWGSLKYFGRFPPRIGRERWWHPPAFSRKYRQLFTSVYGAPLDATRYVGYERAWLVGARAKLQAEESRIKAALAKVPGP